MLFRFVRWVVGDAKPVHVNAVLFVLIAAWGSTMTVLTSEDAFKYCDPYVLFYLKAVTSVLLASVGALKMFMSESYAEHRKSQDTKKETKVP